MSEPKSCAVLVINTAESALPVLQMISRYERLFAAHPIRFLRTSVASDRDTLRVLTEQYKIKEIPALVTREGHVVIGNNAICEFIPRLARFVNAQAGAAQRAAAPRLNLHTEEALHAEQLSCLMEPDETEPDEDQKDSPKRGDVLAQRMAQYRAEMAKRNAAILSTTEPGKKPQAAPVDPAKQPMMMPPPTHFDAPDMEQAPRRAVTMPTRPPSSRAAPPQAAAPSPPGKPSQALMRLMQAPAPVVQGTDDEVIKHLLEMNEESPI